MTPLTRSESLADEPLVPRSLGTLAAALATCGHPQASRVLLSIEPSTGKGTAS